MLLKRAILIFLLAAAAGCSPAAPTTVPTPTPNPTTLVSGSDFEGVIFSADLAAESSLGPLLNHPSDYWTPGPDQVQDLEAGLEDFLLQNGSLFRPDEPILDRLKTYKRQYIGLEQDGKAWIYASFFCSLPDNWQTDFVFVMDGGDCFFQLKYDPQSKTYADLQVNGEA